MTCVALLGLPTDRNSSFLRGPARGPQAIRRVLRSGASNMTAANGVDLEAGVLEDLGDLALAEDAGDFERIVTASTAAFTRGPAVFLGGDHAVTYPIFRGLAAARGADVQIVHIDAHPDLYDDFEGNPLSHASPFARIMEEGLAGGLTQIGVRTVNAHQSAQIARFGVHAFAPEELAEAMAALPRGPTYISIDLDGLDPAYAPGVSHHEPGGLTVREVLAVIRETPGPVIGGDIVELNPDRDVNEVTAALAAKLLKELVGRIVADG
jgi:arginase